MNTLTKNLDTPYGTFDFYQSERIISDDWTLEERLFVASEMCRVLRVALVAIPREDWLISDGDKFNNLQIFLCRLTPIVHHEPDNEHDVTYLLQHRPMILWWAGLKDDDTPHRPNGFKCGRCGSDMTNLEHWKCTMESIEIGCGVCEFRTERRLR